MMDMDIPSILGELNTVVEQLTYNMITVDIAKQSIVVIEMKLNRVPATVWPTHKLTYTEA